SERTGVIGRPARDRCSAPAPVGRKSRRLEATAPRLWPRPLVGLARGRRASATVCRDDSSFSLEMHVRLSLCLDRFLARSFLDGDLLHLASAGFGTCSVSTPSV